MMNFLNEMDLKNILSKKSLKKWLPFIDTIEIYQQDFIWSDLNAGIVTFVLLIPQGMAYALLAGLPPVYGLYTATIPLYTYALFGTSQQISMGPMAITSLLVGTTLGNMNIETASQEWIDMSLLMASLVGLILLIMGFFNLGLLTNFLSLPVMSSFTTASALIIALNQVKYLLGLSVPRFDYTHQLIIYLFSYINHAKWPAMLCGFSSLIILYIARSYKRNYKIREKEKEIQVINDTQICDNKGEKIKDNNVTVNNEIDNKKSTQLINKTLYIMSNGAGLLTITIMGAVAYGLKTNGHDIHIVGTVPEGLKSPSNPFNSLNSQVLSETAPQALVIAVVAFMGNWAVATKYSLEKHYEVQASQELIASGLANLFGSFFNGYVCSAGLARSAVNAEAGAQTQVSGIISATMIIFALLFMTEAFYYIPMATLGAIIMIGVISMIKFEDFQNAYNVDKNDFYVMILTFLTTFFLGIMEGIAMGVSVSLIFVLKSSASPHIAHLGKIQGHSLGVVVNGNSNESNGSSNSTIISSKSMEYGNPFQSYWRNIDRHPNAQQIEGVAVMRMDASLYFGNASYFKSVVLTAALGNYHSSNAPIKLIILDVSGWIDIDLTGIRALNDLHSQLLSRNTLMSFANVKGPVRDRLILANFVSIIGRENYLFMSIDDALVALPRREESVDIELALLDASNNRSTPTMQSLEHSSNKTNSHKSGGSLGFQGLGVLSSALKQSATNLTLDSDGEEGGIFYDISVDSAKNQKRRESEGSQKGESIVA